MNRIVDTDTAPAAVGAYSQATETDDRVFTAGQIPLTPVGELLDDADIDDFDAMNDTYASFFDADPHAQSAIGVDELPKGVGVGTEAAATE